MGVPHALNTAGFEPRLTLCRNSALWPVSVVCALPTMYVGNKEDESWPDSSSGRRQNRRGGAAHARGAARSRFPPATGFCLSEGRGADGGGTCAVARGPCGKTEGPQVPPVRGPSEGPELRSWVGPSVLGAGRIAWAGAGRRAGASGLGAAVRLRYGSSTAPSGCCSAALRDSSVMDEIGAGRASTCEWVRVRRWHRGELNVECGISFSQDVDS